MEKPTAQLEKVALAESAPSIQKKMFRRSDTQIVSAQSIGKPKPTVDARGG